MTNWSTSKWPCEPYFFERYLWKSLYLYWLKVTTSIANLWYLSHSQILGISLYYYIVPNPSTTLLKGCWMLPDPPLIPVWRNRSVVLLQLEPIRCKDISSKLTKPELRSIKYVLIQKLCLILGYFQDLKL